MSEREDALAALERLGAAAIEWAPPPSQGEVEADVELVRGALRGDGPTGQPCAWVVEFGEDGVELCGDREEAERFAGRRLDEGYTACIVPLYRATPTEETRDDR